VAEASSVTPTFEMSASRSPWSSETVGLWAVARARAVRHDGRHVEASRTLRARGLDGFEQAVRGVLRRVEGNGRFGERRVLLDGRRGQVRRGGLILEDDLGLADLDATAVRERDRLVEARAVVVGAVGRAEVLQHVAVALAPHLRVDARGERVGHTYVVARRTPDGDAQTPQRQTLRRAVWIIN
jgi:hypothetical protein